MTYDSTLDPPASQSEAPYLVSADYHALAAHLKRCPAAGTLVAYSLALRSGVLLSTRCRRWNCPHCGPRRIASVTHKVVNAKPNKLMTLTINPEKYDSPRAAYDDTRKAVSKLSNRIRKRVDEWEYLRILEITKKGWPHYHFVVRGGYVDQGWLASAWRSLTGAYIVDIRKIKGREATAKYVMKYLYKQKEIEWTNRRMSWTKRFFIEDEDEKPPSLLLEEVERSMENPATRAYHELQGRTLTPIGPDAWQIS